jgi:hypothetical protein
MQTFEELPAAFAAGRFLTLGRQHRLVLAGIEENKARPP